MAKQRHPDNTNPSSKTPLIMMGIGALLVAGLIAWALMRTVEAPTTTTAAAGSEQFPTSTVATPEGTAPAIADGFSTTTSATTSTDGRTGPTEVPLTLPPPAQPVGDNTTVARLSAEDVRERVNSGKAVVVDVRDQRSYEAAHIPGSLHIPYATVEANLDTLPKGKEIIFYCT